MIEDVTKLPPVLQPVACDAVRECCIWAEKMRDYEKQVRDEALVLSEAGNLDGFNAAVRAGDDWRFRAEALELAARMIGAIEPFQDAVRDLVKRERAKVATKAAPKAKTAGGSA